MKELPDHVRFGRVVKLWSADLQNIGNVDDHSRQPIVLETVEANAVELLFTKQTRRQMKIHDALAATIYLFHIVKVAIPFKLLKKPGTNVGIGRSR